MQSRLLGLDLRPQRSGLQLLLGLGGGIAEDVCQLDEAWQCQDLDAHGDGEVDVKLPEARLGVPCGERGSVFRGVLKSL